MIIRFHQFLKKVFLCGAIIHFFYLTELNHLFGQIGKGVQILGNDHLIEFQLIEIVFYHLIEIMLIT